MDAKDKHLIIAAAGDGNRMQNEIPKQFLKINNKPLIIYSIEAFVPKIDLGNIIIVTSKNHNKYWDAVISKYPELINCRFVLGGPTRFHSIKAGLKFIPNNVLVAVHDAARPLVSKTVIENCFAIAERKGNAVPVIKINESLRIIAGAENKNIERENLRLVQTPQLFKSEIIKAAYEQMFDEQFTDDATVVEKSGHKIFLAEGNEENFKITTSLDFELASFILSPSSPSTYTE